MKIKVMKGSGYIQLREVYPNGINVNNYPQFDGTDNKGVFKPHIHIPGELNESQALFVEAYGLHKTKAWGNTEIRLSSDNATITGISPMLRVFEDLKVIADVFVALSSDEEK
jgi:hypothetical protein